jgi:hypothetical protein
MGTFTLTIDTANDAFTGDESAEVARILRDAARRVVIGVTEARLKDTNGNTVGAFTLDHT